MAKLFPFTLGVLLLFGRCRAISLRLQYTDLKCGPMFCTWLVAAFVSKPSTAIVGQRTARLPSHQPKVKVVATTGSAAVTAQSAGTYGAKIRLRLPGRAERSPEKIRNFSLGCPQEQICHCDRSLACLRIHKNFRACILMRTYMCACVYVQMYSYIHLYIYVCYMYIGRCLRVHLYIYIYIHATCTCICIYAWTASCNKMYN